MPVGMSAGGNSARGSPQMVKAQKACFLVSNYSRAFNQELNDKLEMEGATLGAGDSKKLTGMGFKEGVPLARCCVGVYNGTITDEVLLIRHDTVTNEWVKQWEQFSMATKLGVLVMAGDADGFQAWAARPEAAMEMQYTPKGRTFVYIDGVLVALSDDGCATVESGKGVIIFADGAVYTGEIEGGKRHGKGGTKIVGGAVTTAIYENGKMVKLIGEGNTLAERGMADDVFSDAHLEKLMKASDGFDPDAPFSQPPNVLTQPRGPKSPTRQSTFKVSPTGGGSSISPISYGANYVAPVEEEDMGPYSVGARVMLKQLGGDTLAYVKEYDKASNSYRVSVGYIDSTEELTVGEDVVKPAKPGYKIGARIMVTRSSGAETLGFVSGFVKGLYEIALNTPDSDEHKMAREAEIRTATAGYDIGERVLVLRSDGSESPAYVAEFDAANGVYKLTLGSIDSTDIKMAREKDIRREPPPPPPPVATPVKAVATPSEPVVIAEPEPEPEMPIEEPSPPAGGDAPKLDPAKKPKKKIGSKKAAKAKALEPEPEIS